MLRKGDTNHVSPRTMSVLGQFLTAVEDERLKKSVLSMATKEAAIAAAKVKELLADLESRQGRRPFESSPPPKPKWGPWSRVLVDSRHLPFRSSNGKLILRPRMRALLFTRM
jgi:hypothetical protein